MSCWDDQCPGDAKFSCPSGSAGCDRKMDASGLLNASETCSSRAGLDWAAVATCHKSGAAVLLRDAAVAFEKKWPSHAHSGPFQVPHVLIGGKDVGTNTSV